MVDPVYVVRYIYKHRIVEGFKSSGVVHLTQEEKYPSDDRLMTNIAIKHSINKSFVHITGIDKITFDEYVLSIGDE